MARASVVLSDTPPTEIYTLSLHDALPICPSRTVVAVEAAPFEERAHRWIERAIARAGNCQGKLNEREEDRADGNGGADLRSEEHTSELQSLRHLVCRLLLEKKKEYRKAQH